MGREDEAPSFPKGAGVSPAGEKSPAPDGGPVTQAGVSQMRARLISELKTPFIERVQTAPSDTYIKKVKIESFDERVMTLPDKEIFDLYAEYTKIRAMNNETTKETARNGILERLELSLFSHGWILGRILKRT